MCHRSAAKTKETKEKEDLAILPAFLGARWTPEHSEQAARNIYLWSFSFSSVLEFFWGGLFVFSSIWLGEGGCVARVWKGQCHAQLVSLTTTGLHPAVAGLLGGCFYVLFVSCSSPWHPSSLHLGLAKV